MTYKAAITGLAHGGGKSVLIRPAQHFDRVAMFRAFGKFVEDLGGHYITAEDSGTGLEDMEVIRTVSKNVTGVGPAHGGSGDPSPFTALGVQAAIAASCERTFGAASLRDRTVCVSGLGHVGMRLAKGLLRAGARVLGTDIDRGRRVELTAAGGRWIAPDRALTQPADVFAPCALGAVLTHETAATLQAPVVAGAANNQLAGDGVAELLQARGVLWAPDFVANAGGIINIAIELEPEGYDPRRARQRVRGIGDTLRRIFADADAADTTPLSAATALARARLAAAS
jgi:leucine dehydrogenase